MENKQQIPDSIVEEAAIAMYPMDTEGMTMGMRTANYHNQKAFRNGAEFAIAWRDKQAPVGGQISPVMNKVLNDLDALDTYHGLEMGQQQITYGKEVDDLIESIKAGMRILRDEMVNSHVPVGGWSDADMRNAHHDSWCRDKDHWDETSEQWLDEYKKTHSPVPVVGQYSREDIAQICLDFNHWRNHTHNKLVYKELIGTPYGQQIDEWLSQYKPIQDTRIEEMREWLEDQGVYSTSRLPQIIAKFNSLFPPTKTDK